MDAPRSRAYRRTAQILSHGLEEAQRWVGAGIGGGQGWIGRTKGVAWEQREEGDVGESSSGRDHGLRMG